MSLFEYVQDFDQGSVSPMSRAEALYSLVAKGRESRVCPTLSDLVYNQTYPEFPQNLTNIRGRRSIILESGSATLGMGQSRRFLHQDGTTLVGQRDARCGRPR